MTAGNATATGLGSWRVPKRYRPETQARALLRLVAPVDELGYGDLDLPGSDRREHMRAREDVQAIADRRPFGEPTDLYQDRARAALRHLRTIADVARDAFAAECEAVDTLECEVMAAALNRIAPLQGPSMSPHASPTAHGPRDLERLIKIDNTRPMAEHDRATAHPQEEPICQT